MPSPVPTPEGYAEGQEGLEAALSMLLEPGAAVNPGQVASCLTHNSQATRCLAVAVLGRVGAPAAGSLTEALDPGQPDAVRALAASGIAGIGPAAACSVRALCRCLTSENAKLREVAGLALSRIGQPSVGPLRLMLQFKAADAVGAAVMALSLIGPQAVDCAGDLEQLALRSAAPLRMACAAALSRITGDLARGVPVLLRALDDADPEVRALALEKLGEIGDAAKPAAPRLLACGGDPVPAVRARSVIALARIRAPYGQISGALTALLQDPAPEVRLNAVIALASYGPSAQSAVPSLRNSLLDTENNVAAAAKAAIEMIEKKG